MPHFDLVFEPVGFNIVCEFQSHDPVRTWLVIESYTSSSSWITRVVSPTWISWTPVVFDLHSTIVNKKRICLVLVRNCNWKWNWKRERESLNMFPTKGEKLENNNKFQTISLVSNVSKLFRKLTSSAQGTRFWCSKSSFKDSISMPGTQVP